MSDPRRKEGVAAEAGGALNIEALEELLEEVVDGLGLNAEIEVEERDGVLMGRLEGEEIGPLHRPPRADDRRGTAPGPADRVPGGSPRRSGS